MSDYYNKLFNQALEHAQNGEWDQAIHQAKLVPLQWDIWQQFPQYGIPDHAVEKILADPKLKNNNHGSLAGFLFEYANNIPDNASAQTLNLVANLGMDDFYVTKAVTEHPNYKPDLKTEGLLGVAHFWNDYEREVKAGHFAMVKSLNTNKVESLTDHRGNKGDSSPWIHLIPHFPEYAQKMQETLLRAAAGDPDIKIKHFKGQPYVHVYRGLSGNFSHGIQKAANLDPQTGEVDRRHLVLPCQPLDSWTTSYEVAARFGNRDIEGQPRDKGVILERWMPVKDLLHSGFHTILPTQKGVHPDEFELVFNHPEPKMKVPTSMLHFQVKHYDFSPVNVRDAKRKKVLPLPSDEPAELTWAPKKGVQKGIHFAEAKHGTYTTGGGENLYPGAPISLSYVSKVDGTSKHLGYGKTLDEAKALGLKHHLGKLKAPPPQLPELSFHDNFSGDQHFMFAHADHGSYRLAENGSVYALHYFPKGPDGKTNYDNKQFLGNHLADKDGCKDGVAAALKHHQKTKGFAKSEVETEVIELDLDGEVVGFELEKGQRGDWQTEGYTLHHEVQDQGKWGKHISVHARLGDQVVGELDAGESQAYKGHLTPVMVEVHPDHRRKGLATAMYQLAEQVLKLPFKTGTSQTKEAKKLWAQPNRPFGNPTKKTESDGLELSKGESPYLTEEEFAVKHGKQMADELTDHLANWLEFESEAEIKAALKFLIKHQEALSDVMKLKPTGSLYRGVAVDFDSPLLGAAEGELVEVKAQRPAEGWSADLKIARSFATAADWQHEEQPPVALVLELPASTIKAGQVLLAPTSKTAKWFEALLQKKLDRKIKQDRKQEREYLLCYGRVQARVVSREFNKSEPQYGEPLEKAMATGAFQGKIKKLGFGMDGPNGEKGVETNANHIQHYNHLLPGAPKWGLQHSDVGRNLETGKVEKYLGQLGLKIASRADRRHLELLNQTLGQKLNVKFEVGDFIPDTRPGAKSHDYLERYRAAGMAPSEAQERAWSDHEARLKQHGGLNTWKHPDPKEPFSTHVPVGAIESTTPFEQVNHLAIGEYHRKLKAGAQDVPHLRLLDVDGAHLVESGEEVLEAARMAGYTHVPAVITRG